jgi:hypothetical protein
MMTSDAERKNADSDIHSADSDMGKKLKIETCLRQAHLGHPCTIFLDTPLYFEGKRKI